MRWEGCGILNMYLHFTALSFIKFCINLGENEIVEMSEVSCDISRAESKCVVSVELGTEYSTHHLMNMIVSLTKLQILEGWCTCTNLNTVVIMKD
jgi:hypothetical protein